MFDYLLNKNEINLDSLTDNIRRYREFEKIIENQKQAFTYLQKINDQKEKIDSLEIKIKIQEKFTVIFCRQKGRALKNALSLLPRCRG